MIAPIENKKIISVLGKHYTPKILQHFEGLEIKNKHHRPFSKESIRMIVNGLQENLDLEYKIMDFVVKYEKKQQKKLEKRLNLLKN